MEPVSPAVSFPKSKSKKMNKTVGPGSYELKSQFGSLPSYMKKRMDQKQKSSKVTNNS